MALIDDINALPTTVGDGQTGHLQNHAIIHAALKDHETRLGARDITGTGTPEGRTAATVGTTYTDTAATNGALRWVKATGTGTTGWRVISGDTGWRDITADYTTNLPGTNPLTLGTGAKLYVRREDNTVFFRMLGPITASSAFGSIIQLLTGWRPDVDTEVPFVKGSGLRHTRSWITLESATAGLSIAAASRSAVAQWQTTESWPTSLPGTPA